MAAPKKPRPTCMIMNPICPTVEQPSCPLTSVWTDFRSFPNSALAAPTSRTASIKRVSAVTTGANRTRRMPPALTKPACISAEAGVGAVIEERSHPWNGTSADWTIAASSRATAANRRTAGGAVPTAAATPETVVAPVAHQSAARATANSPPPARKYRRARPAAAPACGQPSTWPTRSAIRSPIATHVTANRTRWSAATRTSTTSVNANTPPKNRSVARSPAMYRRE